MEGVIQRPQREHTAGIPAAALARAPVVPAAPGPAGAPIPQGHRGNRRLYITSSQETPALLGCSGGPRPGRCGGGARGTHWSPQPAARAELGVGSPGTVPSPEMPRRAGRALRARRGGRAGVPAPAPGGLPAPSAPLAAPPGTAPRRTCPAPYLGGLMELLLQPGHRHAAGDPRARAATGRRAREGRAGSAPRAAAGRAAAGAVGAEPSGAGPGLVRIDTLTSGRVMRPLKGDAGSPAPGAGLADRCRGGSHLGAGAARADPARPPRGRKAPGAPRPREGRA